MKRYKLYDAFDEESTIAAALRINGRIRYSTITLKPETEYETDDDALIESLINAEIRRTFSKKLKERFEETGTPYRTNQRKCCGGRKEIICKVVNVYDPS